MTQEYVKNVMKNLPLTFTLSTNTDNGKEEWRVEIERVFGGVVRVFNGGTEREVLEKTVEWLKETNFTLKGKKIELDFAKGKEEKK